MITPVLLCGGAGTRLWPLSRKSYPKQFTKLVSDKSLYQTSAQRLSGVDFEAPLIVTAADFRFIAMDQLAELGIAPSNILIEPVTKNTAAAVCAAALTLDSYAPNSLMLVAPSDHVIPDADAFRTTVRKAIPAAKAGNLVTFGIRPDRPETGYGWLEIANPPSESTSEPQPVLNFVEKPDFAKAEAMLNAGSHLWNAGIFLFSSTAILDAFATYAPEILAATRASLDSAEKDLSFTRLSPEPWDILPDISIDFAVMEHAQNLSVVPYEGTWSDLGDWQAVWRETQANVDKIATNGSVTAINCNGTLLHATSDAQQLVGIGLDDIIVVAMPDAVLVAHKDCAQKVKEAVALLKSKSIPQAESLPRDYRPWGWYESLVVGPRFQVKRIVVHPSAALSLQSHNHRSEHWVVVEGTARVTVENEVKLLTENQSIYIPLGAIHRLENPGKVSLTLIEVQTGSYLGEDDILRLEDIYSRGQSTEG